MLWKKNGSYEMIVSNGIFPFLFPSLSITIELSLAPFRSHFHLRIVRLKKKKVQEKKDRMKTMFFLQEEEN